MVEHFVLTLGGECCKYCGARGSCIQSVSWLLLLSRPLAVPACLRHAFILLAGGRWARLFLDQQRPVWLHRPAVLAGLPQVKPAVAELHLAGLPRVAGFLLLTLLLLLFLRPLLGKALGMEEV